MQIHGDSSKGSRDVAVYRSWTVASLGLQMGKQGQEHLGARAERRGSVGAAAPKPDVEGTGFSRGIFIDGKQSLHEVRRMRDSPNLRVSTGAPGLSLRQREMGVRDPTVSEGSGT